MSVEIEEVGEVDEFEAASEKMEKYRCHRKRSMRETKGKEKKTAQKRAEPLGPRGRTH